MRKALLLAFSLAVALGAAAAQPVRAADGTAEADITDPALNMHAYTVHIPAGWKFQGTVFQGPPCNDLPFPVYRAYSPDGLTEMRMLPRFDWTFDTNLRGPAGKAVCLPLDRTLTAKEFLRSFVALSGLHEEGDMTIAPLVKKRTETAIEQMSRMAASIPGAEVAGDIAAVRADGKNGSFEIEQRLRAFVVCKSRPWFQGSTHHGCFARIDVLRAPKGKLDALARRVDADDLNTAALMTEYDAKMGQIIVQRGNEMLAAQMQHNNDVMRAQQQHFEQTMALQQHQHEQFMAQLQSSTDSSMRAANASMNARSTATSDWCDYALDLQTVTGSGGTVKVSSSYGHTWANAQGQWYQTNDPNANPNGVLGGTWTEQTRVHGDGTP
jgi:hypothetical protein